MMQKETDNYCRRLARENFVCAVKATPNSLVIKSIRRGECSVAEAKKQFRRVVSLFKEKEGLEKVSVRFYL